MNEPHSSHSFYIRKLNHHARDLSLFKEALEMNPTMVYQCFNEQRGYPRFKPDSKIFILHSTQGTVNDISIGGLSYTYYQLPKETSKPLPEMSTIFSAEKNSLFDIPCTVVTDTVVRKAYSFFPELKQRRIRFNELTEKQLQRLELFILTHAVVPTYDVEEKRRPAAQAQFDHTL